MSSPADLLGNAHRLRQAGRLAEAEIVCRNLIASNRNNLDAWQLLGELALQAANYDAAVNFGDQAIQLSPDFVSAYVIRAQAFNAQKKFDQAIDSLRQALVLAPESPELHCELGNAFLVQQQFDEAIRCYRRALALKPDWPEMHFNIAAALDDKGLPSEAIQEYGRALELRPSYADAHFNLGVILAKQGRIDEASIHYREAIQLQPENPWPRYNESLLMLLRGELDCGWREYEWRWRVGLFSEGKFSQPKWNGENLNDKTILLRAEQGLGDTIQFIRYATQLKNLGAAVLFVCQSPLLTLLSLTPGIDRLIPARSAPPQLDFHIPLLSVPKLLGVSLSSIPVPIPYIFANPELVTFWRDKLRGFSGFKVGIGWRGREGIGPWGLRDIPLDTFSPLAGIPGVRFVNLQHKPSPVDKAIAHSVLQVVDLGDDIDQARGGFMDTAAIMMNLDLVICSDTSLAHLAGALGVPVWLALPHIPDWRWLLDRSDSPWYPTMRLFRQKSPGDWAGVFAEIENALVDYLQGTSENTPYT
jgi:tetratricopeptide (TPR) repeat protein